VPSEGAECDKNSYRWDHLLCDDGSLHAVDDEDELETTSLHETEFMATVKEVLDNKGMRLRTAHRELPALLSIYPVFRLMRMADVKYRINWPPYGQCCKGMATISL
jgi:hypothetical protein